MNFAALKLELQSRMDSLSGLRAGRFINDAYQELCDCYPWPFLETQLELPAPLMVFTPGGNLLTANQSSLETDTTGWAAVAGDDITISRSTAAAQHGSASLALEATTGTDADISATTPTGTSGIPVVAGQVYTARADFLAYIAGAGGANDPARDCNVGIVWYDSAGAEISTIQDTAVTSDADEWVTPLITGEAPSTAVYAAVTVSFFLFDDGDVQLADKIQLREGDSTGWVPGGSHFRRILEVHDTVQDRKLDYLERYALTEQTSDLTTAGSPQFYYVEGDTLKVYPTSDNALSVRALRVAPDLVDDLDTPIVPARYHGLIVDMAQLRAARRHQESINLVPMLVQAVGHERSKMMESLLIPTVEPIIPVSTEYTDWLS